MLVESSISSGVEELDKMIRKTQLEAKGFSSQYYIEWIPYDDLKVIRKIGEGGFATIYLGEWLNGPRFVRNNERRYFSNGHVALKKLKNLQEIFKEVNNLI